MRLYTIRLLDPAGTEMQTFKKEYRDALDALDAAQTLAINSTVEVWSDGGRIARVKKGNEQSGPRDSVSG
jgi:hypothetical protein